MKIKHVKELTPKERFAYWITERESIRRKKEAGKPRPWTDDEILDRYSFTNVRRADDRMSRWLINNWYSSWMDHENILVAITLARFINLETTLSSLRFPNRWLPDQIVEELRARRIAGFKIFSPAYVVRGNSGADKIDAVVNYYVNPLYEIPPKIDTSSMENTWFELVPRFGFGSFMAGQVTADLRWAMTGTWADKDDWAPMGPGSRQGINFFRGMPHTTKMKQDVFYTELQKVIAYCHKHVPSAIMNRLEAMDIQNCCCEYFKYSCSILGIKNPKRLYRPKEEKA